jgi:hypothetical protein
MAGLVVSDDGLPVDDDQPGSGAAARELARHGEPDDARADHGQVIVAGIRATIPDGSPRIPGHRPAR